MRRDVAVLVFGVAAVLGTGTGAVVLPHPGASPSARPSSTAATASAATPFTATPSTTTSSSSSSLRPRASGPRVLGTANLIQREDFRLVGPRFDRLDTEKVLLLDQQPLSACSGEKPLYEIAGFEVEPIAAIWTSQTIRDHVLTETIAQGQTQAETSQVVSRLLTDAVRSCQHQPKGHWRYGPTHQMTVDSGSATWAVSYDGNGIEAGGVAVVQNGLNLGILEVTDPLYEATTIIKDLATVAVRRLA